MLALTKNEAMPRPTPNCFLNASLRRSRSAMTAVMSTSLNVVSIAAVLLRLDQAPRDRLAPLRHADALFGAIADSCRCDRPGARRCDLASLVGAIVLRAVGASLSLVGAVGAIAFWTSCFITRPAAPEP